MATDEMSFWEHLSQLRGVIVRVGIVLSVGFIGFFSLLPYIFNTVILGPCHHNFILYVWLHELGDALGWHSDFFMQPYDVKLININLTDQFFIHLSTAFWMAMIVCLPLLLYLLWTFISPGLYPKERRYIKQAFGMGTVLFYIGATVGYFFIFPLTLRFLINYNLSSQIVNTLSFDSYMDNFLMMLCTMGIVFEMPLVTWLLASMGILNKSMLRKYRRHAIVGIFIVAAVITPTGDPFTLTIVALPLVILYELSIWVIHDPKKATS
jgi:sec-independent protein translocase protein TatC